MNANVATQMITYFPLRWPVSIYMLLVIFFIRVFQNERFNRFLRFFASLINNNGTLRKYYLFSYRCKNVWSIKCHWNVIKRNDSGSLVLNRIAKWTIFVRNRVRVWRPRRQSSTSKLPLSSHCHWAVREEHAIDKAVSARLSSKRIYW